MAQFSKITPPGSQNGAMSKKSANTPATKVLTAATIDFIVHQYNPTDQSSGWGVEAADALSLDPGRVFKTLMISLDGRLCVAIVPLSGSLDLTAAARALGGKKAELADKDLAQRATGYVVGGISPIGQRKTHPTVIDESALEFQSVFVSGGKRGMDIELDPADLVEIVRGVIAPIRGR